MLEVVLVTKGLAILVLVGFVLLAASRAQDDTPNWYGKRSATLQWLIVFARPLAYVLLGIAAVKLVLVFWVWLAVSIGIVTVLIMAFPSFRRAAKTRKRAHRQLLKKQPGLKIHRKPTQL
jgi:hypothetical protein